MENMPTMKSLSKEGKLKYVVAVDIVLRVRVRYGVFQHCIARVELVALDSQNQMHSGHCKLENRA